jgi:hypothetical protein
MILHHGSSPRGATLAEAVFAYSVVFMLTLGLIIVALGIYTYQQVAALAREGARWASVHGGVYHVETGKPMATPTTVWTTAIKPMAAGLDPNQFTPLPAVSWDNPNEMPTYTDTNRVVQENKVTVTVTYRWQPALYLSPVTLKSTSVMNVQY